MTAITALSFPIRQFTSEGWQLDVDEWKRGSFGINWTNAIHRAATDMLRAHFEDKAQAEIER